MDKKLLLKLMPLLVVLTAFADTQLDVLKGIGLSEKSIMWIRFLGLVLAACMPKMQDFFKREGETEPIDEDGIGGGGIKNPPKP